MRIAVIDGQGGGIGKAAVEKLKRIYGEKVFITALGTNALATSLMIKAGADEGATGENAIVINVSKADVIMGPIGIVCANALLGELTPLMATAVASSAAVKILIPMNRCQVMVAGVDNKTIPQSIEDAIEILKPMMGQ